MKKIIAIAFLFLCIDSLYCQDIPRYNHYFTYSYLYNPAFLGSVEASQLNMIYRKQWVGLDGAPKFIHAGLQLPLSQNLAMGLNTSNMEQGLITETSAMGSLAYTVNLGMNKTLSFGFSVGAGRSALDISQLTDFSDPALSGALDRSFYLEGQAGLNLNLNRLNLSISIPKVFERSTFSENDFQEASFGPLNSTFSSISYKFEVSPNFSFEPMGAYRMDDQLEDQWQAYLSFYYKDILWLGGNYSEGYGAAAYAGIEVNNFIKIGYSFDFSNNDLSAFNSHEFFVSLRIGSKKIDRNQKYIDNEKPIISNDLKPKEIDPEEDDQLIEENVELSGPKPLIEKQDTPIKEVEEVVEEIPEEVEEDPEALPKPTEDKTDEPSEVVKSEPIISKEIVIKNSEGMPSGFYVVVGAFVNKENALTYVKQLEKEGYKSNLAYNTKTRYNYVYLMYTQSQEEARNLRDDLRNRDQFKFEDSWVLNIK